MFGGFRIATARRACVTALHPILRRPRIADPWPPQFWRDPFVLGFFVSTIASVSDMATRRKLTSEQSGHVLIGTFKELGGYTPDLGERIEMLGREKDADYWQGVRSAEKLIVYMFGGTSFNGLPFDQDPDVQVATEMAGQTALAVAQGGHVGREAIGGSMMYLLFHVPVERRLGMR